MAGKAVIGVASLICVVGVVIGVVALVRSGGGTPKNEGLSSTQRSVTALCEPAMYKNTCENTLNKAAPNESARTEDIIKAAADIALEGIIKNFNLTDQLKVKAQNNNKTEGTKMAVNECKELLGNSIKKMQKAIDRFCDQKSYMDQNKTWDLRLWLSDAVTYHENCMDGLVEVNATDFRDEMKGGLRNATKITMSILDVVTYFSMALDEIGFDLDTDSTVEAPSSSGGVAGGRRLLGGTTDMLGKDGLPRWLLPSDRRLFNVDGDNIDREGPRLDGLTPNVVVAQDGSGHFTTIKDALDAFSHQPPLPPGQRYVIYVKAGTYDEQVIVTKTMDNMTLYGDGPTKTIVTGKKFFVQDTLTTSKTYSFCVQATNFICKDMGFENTAGPQGHQAVALRADGEQQMFLNCAFNGYQDTLYAQSGSQFFRDCTISGTVDFIFGNGATIFQNCTMIVRMPLPGQFNAVTAQGRLGPSMPTGIVMQGCTIRADPALNKHEIRTYLGRPWKKYAKTVFMESEIGDLITPKGFRAWDAPPHTSTAFYGEYANTGPGATTTDRAKWPNVKVLTQDQAKTYTITSFLPSALSWLKPSGVPFYLGFKDQQ